MSDSKKFFELVSRDESVKAELERASLAAFEALLIKKGLNISFAAGINFPTQSLTQLQAAPNS